MPRNLPLPGVSGDFLTIKCNVDLMCGRKVFYVLLKSSSSNSSSSSSNDNKQTKPVPPPPQPPLPPPTINNNTYKNKWIKQKHQIDRKNEILKKKDKNKWPGTTTFRFLTGKYSKSVSDLPLTKTNTHKNPNTNNSNKQTNKIVCDLDIASVTILYSLSLFRRVRNQRMKRRKKEI